MTVLTVGCLDRQVQMSPDCRVPRTIGANDCRVPRKVGTKDSPDCSVPRKVAII